jgi:hypothetical protein
LLAVLAAVFAWAEAEELAVCVPEAFLLQTERLALSLVVEPVALALEIQPLVKVAHLHFLVLHLQEVEAVPLGEEAHPVLVALVAEVAKAMVTDLLGLVFLVKATTVDHLDYVL